MEAIVPWLKQLQARDWLIIAALVVAAGVVIIGLWVGLSCLRGVIRDLVAQESDLRALREQSQANELQQAFLHSIREQLLQLWTIIAEDIARPIETFESNQQLPFWPCYQSYFALYDNNAQLLLRVENPKLRASIIETFTLGKRLIDQYQEYNRSEANHQTDPSAANPGEKTYARHARAFTVVATYKAFKASVEQLRNRLDAELDLEKLTLPFIDQPVPKLTASKRLGDGEE
ncbi:MAG: hypothetical protein JO308_06520 [Verrucomicrobia bacterium]|nr:hypothetical protein [Verrucomicrobiota bacterium]